MALQNVYVVTQPGQARTYFALHNMTRLSRISQSRLVAFTREEHARTWARSLEDYREAHGTFPCREFAHKPRQLTWVHPTTEAPRELEVVMMPLRDAIDMLVGNGMHLTIVDDPHDLSSATEVTMLFDRAAVCTRLQRAYGM